MLSDVIGFLHDLYYGENALIAWVVTVSPAVAAVAVQLPAVIKAAKEKHRGGKA